ncbi:MAG: hypothetical protein V8K32_09735 [Candidatus Electrothrix gigas]
MADRIDQDVDGSGNAFTGTGDVYATHHHYPPGTAPPLSLSNKFQLARLPRTDARLFGREEELNLLDRAWQDEETRVLVLTAFGGMGKTALMQAWLDQQGYAGADAVYTWSFYSQGTAEDRQASSAEFFDNALRWFGHDGSPLPSEHDRGLKLAELVCRQRTLLILDGLEPLQYPFGGAMDGALRDKGILCLCRQLAAQNNGLLLISSRQPVQELVDRPGVVQHELNPLSEEAGIELFRAAGIRGEDDELAATVKNYDGHALSLNLLATYLTEYESGDIIQQYKLHSLIEFPEEIYSTRHAFKVMAAYEQQLAGSADVQVLYSLGLFDRPVSAGAMACLREAEIPQVGGPINDKVFHAACRRLRRLGLLNREDAEHSGTLDCHPLMRQYFSKRLEELHPDSWQQAHARLYEYFKSLPTKKLPDTLEEMEPLFAAVRHGCSSELHQNTLNEVYWPIIQRKNEHYLCRKLGGFAADLAMLTYFFVEPWRIPSPYLIDQDKAFLLGEVATRIRALGRFSEVTEPLKAGIKIEIKLKNWRSATKNTNNLSELYLILGAISKAVETAQQSINLAHQSGEFFLNMSCRTTLADALHQSGEQNTAHSLFTEAEQIQVEQDSESPYLYSLWGFRYCNMLLAKNEWKKVRKQSGKNLQLDKSLLDVALCNLSLGRAILQKAINQSKLFISSSTLNLALDLTCIPLFGRKVESDRRIVRLMNRTKDWLDQAVVGLRKAGTEHHLPLGLLARAAWCRWTIVLMKQADTITQAVQDLQETEEIAQRGGMRLHLIDFHLEAARLSLTAGQDILNRTATEHLAAAKKGIEETGYKRRLPEVANIEEVLSICSPV